MPRTPGGRRIVPVSFARSSQKRRTGVTTDPYDWSERVRKDPRRRHLRACGLDLEGNRMTYRTSLLCFAAALSLMAANPVARSRAEPSTPDKQGGHQQSATTTPIQHLVVIFQ